MKTSVPSFADHHLGEAKTKRIIEVYRSISHSKLPFTFYKFHLKLPPQLPTDQPGKLHLHILPIKNPNVVIQHPKTITNFDKPGTQKWKIAQRDVSPSSPKFDPLFPYWCSKFQFLRSSQVQNPIFTNAITKPVQDKYKEKRKRKSNKQ